MNENYYNAHEKEKQPQHKSTSINNESKEKQNQQNEALLKLLNSEMNVIRY